MATDYDANKTFRGPFNFIVPPRGKVTLDFKFIGKNNSKIVFETPDGKTQYEQKLIGSDSPQHVEWINGRHDVVRCTLNFVHWGYSFPVHDFYTSTMKITKASEPNRYEAQIINEDDNELNGDFTLSYP